MKKILTLVLALPTLLGAQCYDDGPRISLPSSCCENSFFYTKIGGSGISLGANSGGGVALGFGYRLIEGHAAADLSFDWLIGRSSSDHQALTYLTPKIRYLYYRDPQCPYGWYWGGGIAYGGTRSQDRRFRGILLTAVLGYDIFRGMRVRQFLELEYMQPTIRTCTARHNTYAPSLALTLGIGF